MDMKNALYAKHRNTGHDLAAIVFGVCSALSVAAPANAQEVAPIVPVTRLVFHLAVQSAEDEAAQIAAPIRQAYHAGSTRSAVESAVRRAINEAPSPAPWNHPRMVVFAGGGEEALMWSPSINGSETRFTYQDDRVELGEIHAGIGLEAGNAVLALSYVEKDYDTGFGSLSENFAGVSLTWRR
jgi:hypothetical protein